MFGLRTLMTLVDITVTEGSDRKGSGIHLNKPWINAAPAGHSETLI